MKPIFQVLLKPDPNHPGERAAWIPIPIPKDDENLALLADRRGLDWRNDASHDEDVALAYRSALGVVPDAKTPTNYVEVMADCLSKFTPEQFDSFKRLCHAFGLTYDDINSLIVSLCVLKNITMIDAMENGIPVKSENTEGAGEQWK